MTLVKLCSFFLSWLFHSLHSCLMRISCLFCSLMIDCVILCLISLPLCFQLWLIISFSSNFKRIWTPLYCSLIDCWLQSEAEVFDSLQRLELMQLSFDVLKVRFKQLNVMLDSLERGHIHFFSYRSFWVQETEIGKTVNTLRKHSSGRVRALAKKLVRYGWVPGMCRNDIWKGLCGPRMLFIHRCEEL